MDRQGKF